MPALAVGHASAGLHGREVEVHKPAPSLAPPGDLSFREDRLGFDSPYAADAEVLCRLYKVTPSHLRL